MNATAVLANESLIRLTCFLTVLAACLLWQRLRPLRGDGRPGRRQLRNIGMVLLGTLLVRLAFPLLAVEWALRMEVAQFGLLAMTDWPFALELLLAVLLLDLAIYWQHRVFHLVPWLWRMHRMHHSDTGFDVTTGVRFHPLELLLSMAIKFGVIALLGAPALAVLAFETLLSSGALLTHSDAAFPTRLDRWLRLIVVTPSMHRTHHSTFPVETNSNYGFHLSLWDRCFGSYRAQLIESEQRMAIGLESWRSASAQRFPALLVQPFQNPPPAEDPPHA